MEGQACLALDTIEGLYPADRGRLIFVAARCFKAKWVFDLRIIVQLVLAPKTAFHLFDKLSTACEPVKSVASADITLYTDAADVSWLVLH